MGHVSRLMLLVGTVLVTSVAARAGINTTSATSGGLQWAPSHAILLGDSSLSPNRAAPETSEASDCLFPHAIPGQLEAGSPFNPYTAALQDEKGGESASSDAILVRELPPPPNSATLLLTGMLTIGAFQFGRSAKHLHWAAVPEWYHDACPDRIGHTVAFDFNQADMPICFVADIAAADVANHTSAFNEFLRECRSRVQPQFILPVIAPRGPPAAA